MQNVCVEKAKHLPAHCVKVKDAKVLDYKLVLHNNVLILNYDRPKIDVDKKV
jgi:hypothetical protein